MKAAKQSGRYYNALTRPQTGTVVYNVGRSYYPALVSAGQLAVIRYNLRNTKELLKITEMQYQTGLASRTDRDRVQVDYNNLRADAFSPGKMRWGKVFYLHAYLDTQLTHALCQRLAAKGMKEAMAAPIED